MLRLYLASLFVLASLAAPATAQVPPDPCAGPDVRCPNLRMRAPFHLEVDRRTRPGRVLLRAANSIDSVGAGPAELLGTRSGRLTMTVRQRIHASWGSLVVPSKGSLSFKAIPGQGRYWKWADAARFELWSLDAAGERGAVVRTGPKLAYCLRDLSHTRRSRRSPRRAVYPACSRDPRARRVRHLGRVVRRVSGLLPRAVG